MEDIGTSHFLISTLTTAVYMYKLSNNDVIVSLTLIVVFTLTWVGHWDCYKEYGSYMYDNAYYFNIFMYIFLISRY